MDNTFYLRNYTNQVVLNMNFTMEVIVGICEYVLVIAISTEIIVLFM